MDDSVMNWESIVPDICKEDYEVTGDELKSRLASIKRLGLGEIKRDANYLRQRLDEWKQYELWRHFQLSWDMFCELELGKPTEWIDLVIGGAEDHDPNEIRLAILKTQERLTLIEKAKQSPLPKHGGDRSLDDAIEQAKLSPLGERGKVHQGYIITLPQVKRGTNQEYLARRLARDNPESLDKIGPEKEFKSVRQAAIANGIIKPKITVQFAPDDTGGSIASRLYQKLSDEQLRDLLENLLDYLGGTNG